MGINKLSRAAEAAGYAMVNIEDEVIARERVEFIEAAASLPHMRRTEATAPSAAATKATASSVTATAQSWFGVFTGRAPA